MVDHRQIEYLLRALTRNLLSADEFQPLFLRLTPEERMLLLEKADAVVLGRYAPPRSNRRPEPA